MEVTACRVVGCAFGGKEYDELYIVTCSETLPSDGGEKPDAGCVLWRAALAREGFPSTASREREAGGNSLLEKRCRLLLEGNIEFPAGRRARSSERGARGISCR